MTLLQRIAFTSIKWLLMLFIVGGLILAVVDTALRFLRARYNTDGEVVPGYALYEKVLPPPRSVENWPVKRDRTGWEHVNFYQHKFECEFWRSRKQSNWADERERKLRVEPDGPRPLWQEDELSVTRYQCGKSGMVYGPGQGWGLLY